MESKERIEKIINKLKYTILPEMVEEHFPKGKSKERGSAIVLGTLLILEMENLLLKESTDGK